MKDKIIEYLRDIEKKKNVKILLAVESGSREWGFASEDSDYDVRCVHVAKRNDYLSLKEVPNQIEVIDKNIDIVSWDIHKFFQLFLKSNPTVSEWLSSRMIYIENNFKDLGKKDLLDIFIKGFSRSKLKSHYISLAKQNYHKYINTPGEVLLKKYVYILRGLGCVEYIEKTNSLPPLNWKLSSKYLPDKIKDTFARFVEMKKSSEKEKGKRNEETDRWIEKKLGLKFESEKENFDFEEINKIVIDTINNTEF